MVWIRKAMYKGRSSQINILNASRVSRIYKSIPLSASERMASLILNPRDLTSYGKAYTAVPQAP